MAEISNLDNNDNGASPPNEQAMSLLRCNPPESTIIYVKKPINKKTIKRLKCLLIIILVFLILSCLLAFVGLPLIIMHSLSLQKFIMFTNWGLPDDVDYFRAYELKAGLRNLYVSVKDTDKKSVVSLGVWQMLPNIYYKKLITNNSFDFDEALEKGNMSVLLYFHGTGEDRSYGDSSKSDLSEDAVVNDCIQLYQWLTTKTSASIFIWGHSLGTALATRTVASLNKLKIPQPVGLILEAPFTSMKDELYVHPYGKIFSWLPWFEATIVKPLEDNGFIFNTSQHILNVDCPIMIFSAEDDSVIPYKLGQKLFEIAKTRVNSANLTFYYQFAGNLKYDHYFIYEDPYVPYFINNFLYICTNNETGSFKNVN